MSAQPTPRISSRKQPRQARAIELVGAILDAAVQVLATEGIARFTTARVAERAGVSVGSLYQYFPNKAAILFRLQSDEWRQTSALMRRILDDPRDPPLGRLRRLVHAFVRSECAEAAVRIALGDAAPLYRDTPESHAARDGTDETLARFMAIAVPNVTAETRALAGALIKATLSEVGRRFSEEPRTEAAITAFADALADMICAYLQSLTQPGPADETPPGATAR